jgi:hypothetical protein
MVGGDELGSPGTVLIHEEVFRLRGLVQLVEFLGDQGFALGSDEDGPSRFKLRDSLVFFQLARFFDFGPRKSGWHPSSGSGLVQEITTLIDH